jgi:hypothetical protein
LTNLKWEVEAEVVEVEVEEAANIGWNLMNLK